MIAKLLVVDHDEELRAQLKSGLGEEYEILVAEDRATALAILNEQKPLVVLLDLGLTPHPGTPQQGLAVLSDMLAQQPFAKIIIISGQGEKVNALKAIGAGAYDFISKPVDVEELKITLKRTIHVAGLERDYRELQQQSIPLCHSRVTLREARESLERELVLRALNRNGGKIAPAAIELGISRPTLYELMEKLGIQRAERERNPPGRINGASLDRT
jgi:DNA-binding NtrC family response regulator